MRHQWATVHELARIAALRDLPGETLGRLASRMQRQSLTSGQQVRIEDSFAVVITGLVSVTADEGPARTLEPGDSICDRGATTLRTVMPATIATCERTAYEAALVDGSGGP
ncbi:MAG: hypothetical protein ACE5EV_08430 [Gaiellales bacterium]